MVSSCWLIFPSKQPLICFISILIDEFLLVSEVAGHPVIFWSGLSMVAMRPSSVFSRWKTRRSLPRLERDSISQTSMSLESFVEDERVNHRNQRRDEDSRHWQPERHPQKYSDQTQQASDKKSLGGEAVRRIPHLLVGDSPGRANPDVEVSTDLAQDVSEQCNEQADSALDGAADVKYHAQRRDQDQQLTVGQHGDDHDHDVEVGGAERVHLKLLGGEPGERRKHQDDEQHQAGAVGEQRPQI